MSKKTRKKLIENGELERKRKQHRKSCAGKRKLLKLESMKVAQDLRLREPTARNYFCEWCRTWHVGKSAFVQE